MAQPSNKSALASTIFCIVSVEPFSVVDKAGNR